MPRGIPKIKAPALGGAVEQVRGPIVDMIAPGSEESFIDSLPSDTSSTDDGPKPERKKRRSKAEMQAARGEATAAPVDKRLERAQQKCAGMGLASMTEAAFEFSKKPLDDTEKEDVNDQFYLIAKKVGASGDSWIFIVVYTIALLFRLVAARTELGEQVREFINKLMKHGEEEGVAA